MAFEERLAGSTDIGLRYHYAYSKEDYVDKEFSSIVLESLVASPNVGIELGIELHEQSPKSQMKYSSHGGFGYSHVRVKWVSPK